MPKNYIPDYIWSWKEQNNLFNLDDEELKEVYKKETIADRNLYDFINKKVHPKIRKRLKGLINDTDNYLIEYLTRQGQIYYNTGFEDGMKLILSILLN